MSASSDPITMEAIRQIHSLDQLLPAAAEFLVKHQREEQEQQELRAEQVGQLWAYLSDFGALHPDTAAEIQQWKDAMSSRFNVQRQLDASRSLMVQKQRITKLIETRWEAPLAELLVEVQPGASGWSKNLLEEIAAFAAQIDREEGCDRIIEQVRIRCNTPYNERHKGLRHKDGVMIKDVQRARKQFKGEQDAVAEGAHGLGDGRLEEVALSDNVGQRKRKKNTQVTRQLEKQEKENITPAASRSVSPATPEIGRHYDPQVGNGHEWSDDGGSPFFLVDAGASTPDQTDPQMLDKLGDGTAAGSEAVEIYDEESSLGSSTKRARVGGHQLTSPLASPVGNYHSHNRHLETIFEPPPDPGPEKEETGAAMSARPRTQMGLKADAVDSSTPQTSNPIDPTSSLLPSTTAEGALSSLAPGELVSASTFEYFFDFFHLALKSHQKTYSNTVLESRENLRPISPEKDTIFIPVHHSAFGHWTLIEIAISDRHINHYDSLGLSHTEYKSLQQAIFDSLDRIKINRDGWQFSSPPCPRQQDRTSCGVHALITVLHLIVGAHQPTNPPDCNIWRQVFTSLLSGEAAVLTPAPSLSFEHEIPKTGDSKSFALSARIAHALPSGTTLHSCYDETQTRLQQLEASVSTGKHALALLASFRNQAELHGSQQHLSAARLGSLQSDCAVHDTIISALESLTELSASQKTEQTEFHRKQQSQIERKVEKFRIEMAEQAKVKTRIEAAEEGLRTILVGKETAMEELKARGRRIAREMKDLGTEILYLGMRLEEEEEE